DAPLCLTVSEQLFRLSRPSVHLFKSRVLGRFVDAIRASWAIVLLDERDDSTRVQRLPDDDSIGIPQSQERDGITPNRRRRRSQDLLSLRGRDYWHVSHARGPGEAQPTARMARQMGENRICASS